ncbi:MAG TPA: 2-amino-4-hydroxy-6-hydroxymethyldihydropteridine diphosphokinase [Ignavibacteriaceae bacterium]
MGLGSNVGDKAGNLDKAIQLIKNSDVCEVHSVSSFYESKPFGILNQDDFINAVIKIKTAYQPEELYHKLKSIESEIGRKKTIKWGPRIIDLDILFFNDLIYENPLIKIPHKGIMDRDFVLVPMNEIDPDFIHPELNKKISDICTTVKIKTIISKLPVEASEK